MERGDFRAEEVELERGDLEQRRWSWREVT